MVVAHLYWGLSFGGIETMLVNIANAQARQGVNVHLVIVNELLESSLVNALDKNVYFHCLGRRVGSKNPWFIIKINLILSKIKPDAIHLHHSEFFAILLKRFRKISSSTVHALPSGTLRQKGILPRILPILNVHVTDNGNVRYLDKVPRVFAISNAVQEKLLSNYGIKSTVVANGIDTRRFVKRDLKLQANSPLKIVCVSRLDHKIKGQDLLIHATASLKGKIDVTLVGDGKSKEYLLSLSKKLNVSDNVHLLGKKSQAWIAEHLMEYDVFAQPSRNEGFGLTVAEGMAAGLPALVSSGQGPAEITENEHYGWTFKNGDVNELINKIKYIIEHYNEALSKAQKGLQHVKDCYDVSVTAKKYLNLYLSKGNNIK